MPAECRMVTEAQDASLPREPTAAEGIKIAIHPVYPEQSCYDRRKPIRKRKNGTLQIAKRKLGYICLETGRHDRRSTIHSGTPFERPRRMPTHKAKKKGQASDRNIEIQEEVAKLVEAEIMREVHYHEWLSNPVMVKKHDGSWRMCVDFTDLNKSCPKDCYPLPEID
ncbi:hypothetical protein Tco_1262809 [Tanacetum coccineum]